jgi:6,7-dimethyl-8-ribityllumazine synthase
MVRPDFSRCNATHDERRNHDFMGREFTGNLDGKGLRFAVCTARFNEHVTRKLLEGALRGFAACGVAATDVDVIWVPGSFELPSAAKAAIEHLGVDGVVALGAIVRGETAHFDFVAKGATDGLMTVGLETGRPVIFGVLTCDTFEQAFARAGDGNDNKGFEGALGAVEGACLLRDMRRSAGSVR